MAVSLAAHGLLVFVALSTQPVVQKLIDTKPVTVSLIDANKLFAPPSPTPAPEPPSPKKPAPAKAAPKRPIPKLRAEEKPVPAKPVVHQALARKAAHPAQVSPVTASDDAEMGVDSELSPAELAGAASAGEGTGAGAGNGGGGGGSCDMAARVQAALRKDPLVRAAVARYVGKAVKVWDGDWIWMRGDDGKGLTAVRQAMMWEIAFAPAACRTQAMHGLVVFSATGAEGPVRIAIGSGRWRWADLLTPHPGAAVMER